MAKVFLDQLVQSLQSLARWVVDLGYWGMGCEMGLAWKCGVCKALFEESLMNELFITVAGGISIEFGGFDCTVAVTRSGSRGTLCSLSVISWVAFLPLRLVTPGFFPGFSGVFDTMAISLLHPDIFAINPDIFAAFLALFVQYHSSNCHHSSPLLLPKIPSLNVDPTWRPNISAIISFLSCSDTPIALRCRSMFAFRAENSTNGLDFQFV